jgi:tRNA(Ile)-lysidine synthase
MRLACKLPHDCYIAFSGGSDSSALTHFALSHPKRKVALVYVVYQDFNHVDSELAYVTTAAKEYNLDLILYYAELNPGNLTKEQHWSIQRNKFFNTLDKPVLTGHNLDDALEWFMMTSTRGNMIGKLMPIINKNVQRPLLFTNKQTVMKYIDKHDIKYFYDITNSDTSIARNEIRHNVIPSLVKINPGVYRSLIRRYGNIPG